MKKINKLINKERKKKEKRNEKNRSRGWKQKHCPYIPTLPLRSSAGL